MKYELFTGYAHKPSYNIIRDFTLTNLKTKQEILHWANSEPNQSFTSGWAQEQNKDFTGLISQTKQEILIGKSQNQTKNFFKRYYTRDNNLLIKFQR